MLRSLVFALALCSPVVAQAAEQALFEILIEMNRNDRTDRAMLVVVGDKIDIEEGKPLEAYPLAEGQRADLLLFLDVDDDALSPSDTPSFRKEGIALRDVLPFVLQPVDKGKGSLDIITSNGFGNTANVTETLTIVYRDGAFRVAGWATDAYNSREETSSHCSVNYLANKAVRRENDGKDKRLKGKFVPRLLSDWKVDEPPVVCEE